jgi:5-methylcytosine-specific restriction protein A
MAGASELQEATKRFVDAERRDGPWAIVDIATQVATLGLESPDNDQEQQRLYNAIRAYATEREGGTLLPGKRKPGVDRRPRKRLTAAEQTIVDELLRNGMPVPEARDELIRRGSAEGHHPDSVYDAIYARKQVIKKDGVKRARPERSREHEWLRDELILALDLYLQDGSSAPPARRKALSDLLRSIPIEQHLTSKARFRSPRSVDGKLANFLALDPAHPGGLEHVGKGDRRVWEELAHDPMRAHAIAESIRTALSELPSEAVNDGSYDGLDAAEGRLLTRLHVYRERSRTIVEAKRRAVRAATGALACEGCGLDFERAYGAHGAGYIECHHLKPVSELAGDARTALADLAVVCSNCHRMIHRRRPWLTVAGLNDVRVAGLHGSLATANQPRGL